MKIDDLTAKSAVVVAAGCLVLLAVTGAALAIPAARQWMGLTPVKPASYVAGDRIDVPSSIYDDADYTLVLFARSDCVACQHAKGFLTRLAAALASQPSVRMVMATGAVNRIDGVAYARELGLDESRLVTVNFSSLRVRQVPTLVLVTRDGIVRQSWEAPSVQQQDDLLRTMTSIAPPH